MDRVRDFLEERQVRNVIVLADTCHAGKLITRGERGLAVRPYIEKVKKEQNIPKGWVFMVGADRSTQEETYFYSYQFNYEQTPLIPISILVYFVYFDYIKSNNSLLG